VGRRRRRPGLASPDRRPGPRGPRPGAGRHCARRLLPRAPGLAGGRTALAPASVARFVPGPPPASVAAVSPAAARKPAPRAGGERDAGARGDTGDRGAHSVRVAGSGCAPGGGERAALSVARRWYGPDCPCPTFGS
jgi:hypothetical protein